jgi:hypothetical protein
MQNSERIKLNDGETYDFDIADGWIYFDVYNHNPQDEKAFIYRMRTDGTEKTLITETSFSGGASPAYITVVGDWIYYQLDIPKSGPGPIYRIKTDGTEHELIY